MEEILGPNGLLKQNLENYEFRAQQLDLANRIESFLQSDHRFFAVEAPTGIGKTFAALIPAILWAENEEKNVLFLTSGITLQEQIIHKDLPFLLNVLDKGTMSYGLLKGRGNYVCIRKAQELSTQGFLAFDDQGQTSQKISEWLFATQTGDTAELGISENHPARQMIASSFRTCLGTYCPFHEQCFYQKALKNSMHWRIVVANYHVFFAYRLGLEKAFPVRYDLAICDEAHRMADAARSVSARESSAQDWQRLLKRPPKMGIVQESWLKAVNYNQENFENSIKNMNSLSHSVFTSMEEELPEGKNYKDYPHDLQISTQDLIRESDTLVTQINGLRELAVQEGLDAETLTSHGEIFRWGDDLQSLLDSLRWCSDTSSYPNWAYWKEKSTLKSAPVTSSELIPEAFQPLDDREAYKVVAMSATLTVDNSFEFWAGETGLIPDETAVMSSPFNLRSQMEIDVADLGAGVMDVGYDDLVARVCRAFCRKNGGATLVLLSSRRLLSRTAGYMRHHQDDDGYEVLIQGELPKTELLERFRSGKAEVLIGMASFREGIDVPGEALTQVIIDRIPFPHPGDPLVEARAELEGNTYFRRITLPTAKMQLRQAVGRLIRTETDHGKVVILDGRILKRSDWGFLKSFPRNVTIKKVRVINQTVAP